MKKKILMLGIAVVAMSVCLYQMQADVVGKPATALPETDAYAEGVYAEYAAGAGKQILFEVETLASGRLAEIAQISFGELIAVPAYRIEAEEFGTQLRNPHFTTADQKAADLTDLEATAWDFEEIGYPLEMGVYRLLGVGVAIDSTIREHEALEFCWPELGHCAVLDSAIPFLQSIVSNRLRLSAEGWGPRLVVERRDDALVPEKTYCGFASHPDWTNYYYYWSGYTVQYKNIFGTTLVEKFLGSQKAGLACDTNCYPAPYGHSNSSSCWGTLGWTCACDSAFGYGTTNRTGKWIAETKCTHQWVQSAKASATVKDMGSASVDITWTLGGGVDANGGYILDTCMWF